jgi:hypothetical protein
LIHAADGPTIGAVPLRSFAVRIPRLDHPQDYAGLFLYDFGDHVSVGYTAEEIRILLTTPQHARGKAYLIYRVDEAGCFELRGMSEEPLGRKQGIVFSYREPSRARTDFDWLRAAAAETAPHCAAELQLVQTKETDLPWAVVLSYPQHASALASAWLSRLGFAGGDGAASGVQVTSDSALVVEHCRLQCDRRLAPRSKEEVLARVDEPVQR